MEFLQLTGRLHPLILHLPIGFLVLAFMMEVVVRRSGNTALQPAVRFALKWGTWSAIFAAASGYVLSLEGGYEPQLLQRHQWLGIATTTFSLLTYWRYTSDRQHTFTFVLFIALLILMTLTGHFGGALTHGSDFLTAPMTEEPDTPAAVELDSLLVFQQIIQPIFKEKCNSCHNPSKQKGSLVMSTIEGLRKGGKTGPLLIAGDPISSLLIKRITMGLDEKKHMPPKGKRQLTDQEQSLLAWWIQEGGSFQQHIAETDRTENIQHILEKHFTPQDPLLEKGIAPATESQLAALAAKGVYAQQEEKGQPFLSIDLSGRQDLDMDLMKKIAGVKKQLVALHLQQSNLNDAMLQALGTLPHLRRLGLQQTAVTSDGLEVLKGWTFLESLNLYATAADDRCLPILAALPNLKRLYAWQSELTTKGLEDLRNDHPALNINTGVDPNIFGKASLSRPTIVASRDIFEDTLQVAFVMSLKGVELRYTLDGSIPDSNAALYQGPFVLDRTATVKVFAQKEGWETSELSERVFARLKYRPAKVALSRPPSDRYPAKGSASLTDGIRGAAIFSDGNWLGYEHQHFTATFDMGRPVEVSTVNLSALEDVGSWIFFPKGVSVELSDDGQTFRAVQQRRFPTAAGPKPAEVALFSIPFPAQTTRYVRVKVESNLVNPDWHPNPGGDCWVFVDEILIE